MEDLTDRWENISRVMEAALRVLLKYPLCDRCLGRLFARLGRGIDNADRGRAIKTFLAMFLAEIRLREDELENLKVNIGLPLPVEPKPQLGHVGTCYICGSELDRIILELGEGALKLLKDKQGELSSFLVGVEAGSKYEKRELEVIGVLGLDTWESVRREVKRLVGKYVSRELSITPSFSNPDVLVVLDLENRKVDVKVFPLLLRGKYVKTGRYISQMPWVRRNGTRKYKLSIYETCQSVLEIFGGKKLVLHAAGREDADARVLGDGRPVVIEIKDPVRRSLPNTYTQEINLRSTPWTQVIIYGKTTREYVRAIKTRPTKKTYRIVAIAPEGLREEDVLKVLSLSNKVIYQRTPTRVLDRRKDVVRRKRVYEVSVNLISKYLLETLIRVDGGLYVKEFVDGDNGRTTPSFSEVTGKRIKVVMLDVLTSFQP
ncbi:MAG: tRNA pseudouridine(54/55) synthase Pus10 [Sulfolobales archaeon]